MKYIFLVLIVMAQTSYSACITPAGVEKQIVYNTDFHTYQYCNGSTWQVMGSVVSTPWQTSGNNTYYTTGNVGAGTSNPSVALEVSGTISGTNVTGFISRAYAVFSGSAASPITVSDSMNITNAQVTRIATSMYQFNFPSGVFTSPFIRPACTSQSSSGSLATPVGVLSETTTSMTLNFGTVGQTLANPLNVTCDFLGH